MSDAMITRRGGGGGSANLQSKTVAPAITASIVTPDSGYDGLSSVTVAAISPTKEAQLYTPGTQDQVITAWRWLTGAQTIAGDENLVAANIKKGVSIFNVAGSYEAAGLDTNSAVLKVITSTGCSVTVTNGTDSFTQQDADGFVRPNDAAVTEHFFMIPTAAFGTFTVTSTHPTYGDNTKTNAVVIGEAGKIYEVLCGGVNIILDGTFGLQDGISLNDYNWQYSDIDKRIIPRNASYGTTLFSDGASAIPVSAYSSIKISAKAYSSSSNMIYLRDADNRSLCSLSFMPDMAEERTGNITNKYYPTAGLYSYCNEIKEIILT
jgi:hypothetical protein